MASLFTSSEKQAIERELSDVHDTFKRDIYAFVEEAQEVNLDSSYNALYGRGSGLAKSVTNKILTKYTIGARIFYPKQDDEDKMRDLNLPSAESLCRVKVSKSDWEILKKASVVEIDSEKWVLASGAKAIGPFRISSDFVSAYLKPAG